MNANPDDRPSALRLAMAGDSVRSWLCENRFWVWVSRVIGIGLVVTWWLGVQSVLGGDSEAGGGAAAGRVHAAGLGLLSFAALIAGAVFLVPSILPYAVRPFFAVIDSVYLGGSAVERPPLNYAVAERLCKERRWEDAAAEFERIAYWHRGEVRAYREGIRAARLAEDEAMATWLYRRGVVNCPKAAAELRQARRGMVAVNPMPPSRLAPDPE